MKQTIASLKRTMTVGTRVHVENHVYPDLSGVREVLVAQSSRWCLSFPEDHPKHGEGQGSWLDIPKAADVTWHGYHVDAPVMKFTVHHGLSPFCTITVLSE